MEKTQRDRERVQEGLAGRGERRTAVKKCFSKLARVSRWEQEEEGGEEDAFNECPSFVALSFG